MYTIVVADDEEELRSAIVRRINWEEIGFSVVGEAENGIEALELVDRLEPDLLLTDIRMPFISGIELARQEMCIRDRGELSKRLIAGGYRKDTPAAIVYKATWPEEESYICTIEGLEETAAAHGITKTALILVGDVIAHRGYEKSRLYAPDFSTEFRQAKE